MAVLEVALNEDGSIAKLPDQLQKLMDARISEAFGKGASKAAEEAKAQLEAERQKAKPDHTTTEKLKTLEAELSKRQEADALREKDFAEAQRIRDERHLAELKAREDALESTKTEMARRDERIRQLAGSDIKLYASQAGARTESLAELETLLGARIGISADLRAFVRDATDPTKPALDKDGKPVTVEGLVTSYLTDHPHHKAAPSGRGGGANGGRSLSGLPASGSAKDMAFLATQQAPTVDNLARAFALAGKE